MTGPDRPIVLANLAVGLLIAVLLAWVFLLFQEAKPACVGAVLKDRGSDAAFGPESTPECVP